MLEDKNTKNLEDLEKKGGSIQEENEPNVSEEVKEEETKLEDVQKQEKELEIDEVESLKNEIRVLKDENSRLRSEFINYRNALIRESEEVTKRYKERMILRIIEIYDKLGRALRNAEGTRKGFISGVRLIHKSIEKLMFDEGLSLIIPEVGRPFDPFAHEVEETITSNDVPDMAIHDVVEHGYYLNGKVLKPARVVVAINNSSESE